MVETQCRYNIEANMKFGFCGLRRPATVLVYSLRNSQKCEQNNCIQLNYLILLNSFAQMCGSSGNCCVQGIPQIFFFHGFHPLRFGGAIQGL